MKIAVAFFGIPRCSEVSWPTIQQNLVAHFPVGAEVRYFYHFYQQDKVVNPRSGENASLEACNYHPFMEMTGLLEKPEDILPKLPFEEMKACGDAWGDGFNSLRNLLLQLSSLKQVTALMKDFAPDVVLFARPDLAYHDPIPTLIYQVVNEQPKAVFVPNWQWGKGLNDTFAVCGREIYQAYGNRLDNVHQYCSSAKDVLHSERLLKFSLLKAGAEIYQLETKASRVRVGGVFAQENYKSHTSFFGPITNPAKRFFFITKWKTKFLLARSCKKFQTHC